MAKLRRLVKALEADGWTAAAKREDFVLYTHRIKAGRLTLPSYKCAVPDAVALELAALAAIVLKPE